MSESFPIVALWISRYEIRSAKRHQFIASAKFVDDVRHRNLENSPLRLRSHSSRSPSTIITTK
ncbi:unnamed protein product [Nesidiocoris tenuis]|uniref:Uncharacterized protein n=1 Tax=Nesidiocoris tenuis TaxID=355587 RepID=A0A6H5G570_9HEMI|nr:unnamed protein product [Nesidiocoris tenuis]CAA9997382.1 unnamed protein product [Nesidiocoris tenuis]